jgi:alkylated DNA repair dioxygenase AlkB
MCSILCRAVATLDSVSDRTPNSTRPVASPLPFNLFGFGDPAVAGMAGVERYQLDPCCWVDYVAGFVDGADQLFVEVQERFEWFRGERLMYGNWHSEPRLTAALDLGDETVPAVVGEAAAALGGHYRRGFSGLFCNYYQNGNDSVAWHADRIGRTTIDPLVAIISLGGPRTFAMRDVTGASRSQRWVMHSGDLLVMGGATQHHWEHGIAKVADAPPRISLTTRAGWNDDEPLDRQVRHDRQRRSRSAALNRHQSTVSTA